MDLCNEPDAMTHPEGMQIKVSRQELSRLVGCSREMAGRVLKVLEEQGLLTRHRQDHGGLQRASAPQDEGGADVRPTQRARAARAATPARPRRSMKTTRTRTTRIERRRPAAVAASGLRPRPARFARAWR